MKTLDKDVYDALELSALAHGGIGADRTFDYSEFYADPTPCCLMGHVDMIAGRSLDEVGRVIDSNYFARHEIIAALCTATGENYLVGFNDRHVRRVNAKRGLSDDLSARVPFDVYMKEAGIERGD